MKILVTGCRGQLGTEISLLADSYSHHQFILTDVQELDICNIEAIREIVKKRGVECIINCAAYTQVDKAESDEEKARMLNADAPCNLAEVMEEVKGLLVHVSTDYVFDGASSLPYKETDVTCPASVYGYTKLEGEQAIIKVCSRYLIMRTAWLYSPFGNNFVKTMMRLGHEKSELGVVADQVGTPTYARDLAITIFEAIEQNASSGIYHFSNEGCISWYDFTKAIHRLAGITTCQVWPIKTTDYPTAAARPHYSVLDKSKIKDTLKIQIPYWEDSLKECIQKRILSGQSL